ncbi:MAG: YvcK family protein [Thermoleophilia bacterium]|jgi:uncharacterized cofD-like protein|nr:YvcK family protein [Thermoleophilia bacterium]
MRRYLDWLYPGIGLKRWVFVAALGVVLLSYTVFVAVGVAFSDRLLGALGLEFLTERRLAGAVLVLDGLVVGALLLAVGLRKLWRFQRTNPETASEMRPAARLARGPRVTAVGGGTGLSALLGGLKHHSSNLTAIVTMADDGGSSGLLRRHMGMPPPGDIRNCLVALADDESLMSRLFQYRFPDGGGLEGHSFGNLFVAALAEVTGDFETAVRESTRVLKVRGRVIPSTLEDVVLHAQLEDGARVSGESEITAAERLPLRVWLEPDRVDALPEAIAALDQADLVVLGPGSLYTSIMPNLLIAEVREALERTRAWVVYVCNIMTQPGETDGYTTADHLDALYRHGVAGMVDAVLVNDTPVSGALAASYEAEGAIPVRVDEERLRALGIKVVHADVAATGGGVVRHDPGRLAEALLGLLR